MAHTITHNLHPSDVALEDTTSYNQWFNTIVTLRDKAEAATDSTQKAQYIEAMHGVVSHMEGQLSDDSTAVDIGPMLDMWEVEGGKSFGAFAEQMAEGELEASFTNLFSSINTDQYGNTGAYLFDAKDYDLSSEQTTEALQGVVDKKKTFDKLQERSDAWDATRTSAEDKMTTLWNRYEDIKEIDPDKDWFAESRFVWWGLADPDNAIQEEIATLGREYRNQDAIRLAAIQPGLQGAGPFPGTLDRAKTDYTSALEALNNLKGE